MRWMILSLLVVAQPSWASRAAPAKLLNAAELFHPDDYPDASRRAEEGIVVVRVAVDPDPAWSSEVRVLQKGVACALAASPPDHPGVARAADAASAASIELVALIQSGIDRMVERLTPADPSGRTAANARLAAAVREGGAATLAMRRDMAAALSPDDRRRLFFDGENGRAVR